MKKTLLAATILILLKTISAMAAGGWTSGGGELIRDQHNPWFIQNTTQVNYCVQINEAEFGQTRDFVEKQISRGIAFWKTQLQELTKLNYYGAPIEVGTQNFVMVDCASDHDLTFQFGVLSDDQKMRLGDISRTIALSVRTDYDLKNLKSKGFIYFSKDNQFGKPAWSSDGGLRLLPILIHEMGHVFGIQHRDDVSFMSESYPEQVLKNVGEGYSTYLKFITGGGLETLHLFKYAESKFMHSIGVCTTLPSSTDKNSFPKSIDQSVLHKFFNVKPNDNCESKFIKDRRFEYHSGLGNFNLIGMANLEREPAGNLMSVFGTSSAIQFWLPKEQIVFPSATDWMIAYNHEIATFNPLTHFKGIYTTVDGKISRPIFIEANLNGSIKKISGMLDNVLYGDLEAGF